MKLELFNRIVAARQILQSNGIDYVTLTVNTNDVLDFGDKVAETLCANMERMVRLTQLDVNQRKENDS